MRVVRFPVRHALLALLLLSSIVAFSQRGREIISLSDHYWFSVYNPADTTLNVSCTDPATTWKQVYVPHNWDAYDGYRRLRHGNRHGSAWYYRLLNVGKPAKRKRYFLFFEGVSSYATIYINDKMVAKHAGGRTTFTIDVTGFLNKDGSYNTLMVRADHPAHIRDLPWVCGGCSEERGFSEGSQPLGIFRPVSLIITDEIRIEPFGVHAWSEQKGKDFSLNIHTTVKNYSRQSKKIALINRLVDQQGKTVATVSLKQSLKANDSVVLAQENVSINNPHLWSPSNPYRYKIVTLLKENNRVIDQTETEFGFRTINWRDSSKRFFINNQPVFINGVAEYEHLLGQSHAFSHEQIIARMKWLKAAGFNAFRDAHQPHNLLYGKLCNEQGILWWTQFSAHIWFDTPEFRKNFLQLLRQWVIERRNDPSVVMWGLQNESRLPEDFARECTELIRQLDPTASSQRLVTTCNGGTGTDWDVPQNWTGTYGGNPHTYDRDLKRQVLVGEYGAWRTLDLHTEGPFVQDGVLSEDRMAQLMELKVRLAESVRDSVAGHYFWLLTSHDNPGRVQGGEGQREIDRIGPVNYKGLLTPWEEPLDVFYMFRANYAPKETSPMVYIVSHTWPSRWLSPGKKDGIVVYSNCDEVELFNDINNISLGRKQRGAIGTHFKWDNVPVQYNVLYAVGYVGGKAVARDTVVLHHLPKSPQFERLYANTAPVTKPQPGYHYLYRLNCGGPEYVDQWGNRWAADRDLSLAGGEGWGKFFGSRSWTRDFVGMPPYFASQRRTFSPIQGTRDWPLFQDFRYGRNKLQYHFPLPNGKYLIELYFTEPWIGIGGGMDGTGMRLFDVAVNGGTVLKKLDIFREVGANRALKKTLEVDVSSGDCTISFPNVIAGQALISAIAIASRDSNMQPAKTPSLVSDIACDDCTVQSWLDLGNRQYANTNIMFASLPPQLFGADYLQTTYGDASPTSFKLAIDADVYIGVRKNKSLSDSLRKIFEDTKTELTTDEGGGTSYAIYRKRYKANTRVVLPTDPSYLVMIQPANEMQPAYDLKPVTPYRTNVARMAKGVQKEMAGERLCAVVQTDDAAIVEWPITTGVADRYSVTVKYHYAGNDTLQANVQWIGSDENILHEEAMPLIYTRPGKWNQYTINTASMINAGNYTIRLTLRRAKGVAISGIDVQ